MSLKLPHYAVAALLVHSLVACTSEPPAGNVVTADANATAPASNVAEDGGKLVLAFGDSLYAGYGVLPQESFPAELQKALAARDIVATVHNAGVSGDTSAAGLQRLAFTLDGLKRKPDLAIVGLGGNDMLRGIAPEQTRANLTAICEELKRRGIPIMLTGMLAAPNMGADYAGPFNAIYPALAKQFDATLYPFFLDGVVGTPTLMLPDHIHPNPQGIDRIVERVAPVVAERLKD